MDSIFYVSYADIFLLVGSLLLLGCVAGFFAGLLGVGGGIILVPGLYIIFEKLSTPLGYSRADLMHVSVGTSLAIIIPTAISSVLAHNRRGCVDLSLVKRLGTGIIIGVTVATFIAHDLSSNNLRMIFATVILILAFIMLADHQKLKIADQMPSAPIAALAGSIIGIVSALIGIGGATLSVPFMSMHGVQMRKAVGSAAAIGLVIAIPASIGFMVIGWGRGGLPPLSLGFVNILAWICVIPASIFMAPLGAKVAHKVSVRHLKIFFAIFMILMALNMWRKILF